MSDYSAYLSKKEVRLGTVQRLRDAPHAALAGATVYDSRPAPIQDGEGTVVNVVTPARRDEKKSDGQPTFDQLITMLIEGHVEVDVPVGDARDGGAVAAALDDLEEAIGDALFEDPTWVKQFSHFERGEWMTSIPPDKRVRRGSIKAILELRTARRYGIDPRFLPDELQRVYVTTRPIDEETGEPSTKIQLGQEIELP